VPRKQKPLFPIVTLLWVGIILTLALQWPLLRLLGVQPPLPWVPLLPGIAVFAAAYLLSWSAEVAQIDIPPALALGLLALVAVLPEYAVDMYFAWRAGSNPSYIPYAAANMTGSNRLLIGLGWPLVVWVCVWKTKKNEVVLKKRLSVEISILMAATVYAFIIPIKGTLSWVDSVVLGSLFLWYFYRILKGNVESQELEEGAAEMIASWGVSVRRGVALVLFFLAGAVIFLAAQPFAEGLLSAGRKFGINEFILVQWLAPLASESPEFIVAAIFAYRGLASSSFNTLLSSKLNQWTLLVGMLPLAFAFSARSFHPMVLDANQCEEIFLTAAMSLLAVVMILDFKFHKMEAGVLFVLFAVQTLYPAVQGWVGISAIKVRYGFAYLYLLISVLLLVTQPKKRMELRDLWRTFFRN
jgi:cation:H+ antiporter